MLVTIIGTNGLLSSSIGLYCNRKGYELNMYGRTEPRSHSYTAYKRIDLLDRPLDLKEIVKSDIIIYTAGAGIQSNLKECKDLIYNLNVNIPVQICNYLKESNFQGHFITFGSYFEIGENISNKAFTEIDLLQSQLPAPNDYTVSKRMLSRFMSSINASFTPLHFILPTIYGETESKHRLIPYVLQAIENDLNLSLTSGEQVRQYIYIDDVVQILFKSIGENLNNGIYNIAGVEELSVKELVNLLFQLKGKVLSNNVFGKADRQDVGMKVLKLDGKKLQNAFILTSATRISEVYDKYNFE